MHDSLELTLNDCLCRSFCPTVMDCKLLRLRRPHVQYTQMYCFLLFIYLNIQDVLGILYVCYTIRFLYMGLLCVSASILLSKGAIDSLPTLPR